MNRKVDSLKAKEKKDNQRFRIAFVLTLFSFYYSFFSFYISSEELVYIKDKTAFKYFIYSSIISTVLTCLSLKKFISNIFYVNIVFVVKFMSFCYYYVNFYLASLYANEEISQVVN